MADVGVQRRSKGVGIDGADDSSCLAAGGRANNSRERVIKSNCDKDSACVIYRDQATGEVLLLYPPFVPSTTVAGGHAALHTNPFLEPACRQPCHCKANQNH